MPPLTVMVKPASSLCNMRCAYCFYADVSRRRSVPSCGMMSLETLERLVRRAFAYADGQLSFVFQGGEPTLAGVGFYEALLKWQAKYNTRGIAVSNAIQTNGYDIPDRLAALLAREGFLVGVSLDGTPEIHDRMRVGSDGLGTYAKVRRTIGELKARGAQVNILCVVNAHVARHPREVFEALRPDGYIQFIPCLDGFGEEAGPDSLSAPDYARFLKETFDQYYHSALSGAFVSVRNFDNYISMLLGQPPENCAMRGECAPYFLIEGDGGVYPCDFYVLDEWRLGNIRDASFARLAASEKAAAFREVSRRVSTECLNCHWRALCRGGCRRDREPVIGGVPRLNRLCAAYRDFFEYAYPRMREIARHAQSGK